MNKALVRTSDYLDRLRDELAGEAMNAILCGNALLTSLSNTPNFSFYPIVARQSYRYADAMLVERERSITDES